jgi:hypothetical protein
MSAAKKKPPKSTGGLAVHWRVGEATIKRWRTKGAPLTSDEEMAAWFATQNSVPPVALARAKELATGATAAGGPPANSDAEWKAFVEQSKLDATDTPKQSLASITRARDFAAFRFMEAAKTNNRSDMKFYADLLSTFDGVVHDAQLRAKKLGIDQGELLPRPEVERIVFALGYWLMRAADLQLDALTGRLKALAPGLAAEAVRGVLEPELLSMRFLEPFARAAKIQSGVSLPEWFVAKMRETAGDYLENGEKSFEAIAKG